MSQPLTIVFAGTPEFAATNLQALLATEHRVIACYTQPDRKAGRGRKLMPSPVKSIAIEADIPVYQPVNFRADADVAALAALKPDLMIVVAYGLLLPQRVLDIPRLGCINVHASLLPRWRGAAPIQRAVAAGDRESGVTIMQMEAGLDTGPMHSIARLALNPDETGGSLHDRLATLGAELLVSTLPDIADNSSVPTPQNDADACYAHKLSKAEGQLDWQQPVQMLARQVRAFNPWPVSYTQLGEHTLRVWSATIASTQPSAAAPGTLVAASREGLDIACADGILRLTEMQLPGSKRMAVADILNSRADWFPPGCQFEQPTQ